MLGTIDPKERRVTVIGAGIAGLLVAYELDRKGYEVTLLEAGPRTGGLISTTRTEWGIAESAAHSLLATPEVRALCEELGVELQAVRPESRARFIYRRRRLRRFPLGPLETLRAFLRAYLVPADRGTPSGQQTLEKWALRHLGRPALDYLLTPFVRGIYGARPSELTVGAAFPSLAVPGGHSLLSHQLHRLRRNFFGPRTPRKPRSQMMAPRQGMGSLVAALEARLETRLGERFRKNSPQSELPASGNIVLAVPAHAAAPFLASQDPSLATLLERVSYTPLVAVTAFVDVRATARLPRGVGVLVPEREASRQCLGILFNSSSFHGRATHEEETFSVTVMLGGSSCPEWVEADSQRIAEVVRKELQALLGVEGGIRHLEIRRWKNAVPRYDAGLQELWSVAAKGWCSRPGRLLFGNYTGQVSVRGMIELAARLHSHDGP